jgi:hypothetical protein
MTYKRLKLLGFKFDVHRCLNEASEVEGTQDDPKDFSTVMKVDTHIHLSAAMVCSRVGPFFCPSLTPRERFRLRSTFWNS